MNYSRLEKAIGAIPTFTVGQAFCHEEATSGETDTVFLHIKCGSIRWLNRFMWAFCRRYGMISTNYRNWWIEIDNSDTDCNAEHIELILKGKKWLDHAAKPMTSKPNPLEKIAEKHEGVKVKLVQGMDGKTMREQGPIKLSQDDINELAQQIEKWVEDNMEGKIVYNRVPTTGDVMPDSEDE